MEDFDEVKKNLKTRLTTLIVGGALVILEGLFVMVGVSYLFSIGGLLLKLLVLVSGSMFLTIDVTETIKAVKEIRLIRSMLKVGTIIEKSIREKTAE